VAEQETPCPNCGLPIGAEPGPADEPCDVCGQGMGMNAAREAVADAWAEVLRRRHPGTSWDVR
jgi:hypothetical protein